MSDLILCDRCVDLVYPRPDCADCERERIVAANPVPDVMPTFISPEELGQIVIELVRQWMRTTHPEEALALITDLEKRTSAEVAVHAALRGLHVYVEQCVFHTSRLDLVIRLRIVPAIALAIKRLALGHFTAPTDLRTIRGSGLTPGGTK